MEEIEVKADGQTTQKYLALISLINQMEKRLAWSELSYLAIDVFVLMFGLAYVLSIIHNVNVIILPLDFLFVLFCPVIGMIVTISWVVMAMRLELKLKLRYFQARYFERKLSCVGEFIFSDESPFFHPSVQVLESPDKKETIHYPTSGMTKMDGIIGAVQPRHTSLWIPFMFFLFFLIFFITSLSASWAKYIV